MKKTINDIWTMTRLAVACNIAFVGMVIGIPGRILSDGSRWVMRVADCVGDVSEDHSMIGKFEKAE